MSGTSGSGKTMSALIVAGGLGRSIGLIDSEKGAASLYVGEPGLPEFSTDSEFEKIDNPSIHDYLASIKRMADAGIDVLIIDSLSHSWASALEAVDRAGGWIKAGKTVSPLLAKLINAILTYPGHVIATMRSKTEYAIEKDEKTGKATMRKLGLAPQVRADTEYEFTVVLDLDRNGSVTVSKSRCGDALPMDQIYDRSQLPKMIARVRDWLSKGAPISLRSEALERIKFAGDDAALSAVVLWLREQAATRPLSAEEREELKLAITTKRGALADDVVPE